LFALAWAAIRRGVSEIADRMIADGARLLPKLPPRT